MPTPTLNAIYSVALIVFGVLSAASIVWATHKGKLIDLLTKERDAWKASTDRHEVERKEANERQEKVIGEYRLRCEGLRNQLHDCTVAAGVAQAELADLRARTDFTPVMEFQRTAHAESQLMNGKILDMITILSPVLTRVSDVLELFGKGTHDVKVVNQPSESVPTTIIPPK